MTTPSPRLHANPHPSPRRTDDYLWKLRLRLLQMGTWRYLRYIHLRDSLLGIVSEIETVGIVGAGHGIAEIALALEFPHIHFTLTDAQFDGYPIYDGAQDVAWQWGIDNVDFGVWNVLQPTKRRFDLVASTEVLEHIEDAATAAQRMREAARLYVYCLVPFANAEENANPERRAYALDRHGHFEFGYDRDRLGALFPDHVHIKGAYFKDAGRKVRERLGELDAADIPAAADALYTLAEADIRDTLPASAKEGQGIRILARAPSYEEFASRAPVRARERGPQTLRHPGRPKIFVEDGNRRFENSGYGQLSRSIMRALIRHTDFNVLLRQPEGRTYPDGTPDQALFDACPTQREVSGADLIFRVGPPTYKIKAPPQGRPTILYTQNALGGLTRDWADNIANAATVIVPGEFDRKVFANHHKRVEICPQIIDTDVFVPSRNLRAEGPHIPSFLFVGSFGYRKGTDLVFDTFSKAFPGPNISGVPKTLSRILRNFGDGAPVNIHMHCFSGVEAHNLSVLVEGTRRLPDNIRLTVDSRSLSPTWMHRIINSHDAVFTLSRGEGWSMPLWESLMCGLPVIAPDSTAMGEWLPDAGVELFKTRPVEIASIKDFNAGTMRKRYGEPGITLFEPDTADAARAIRKVYDNLDNYKAAALANRDALAKQFSVKALAARLSPIIDDTLKRLSASQG